MFYDVFETREKEQKEKYQRLAADFFFEKRFEAASHHQEALTKRTTASNPGKRPVTRSMSSTARVKSALPRASSPAKPSDPADKNDYEFITRSGRHIHMRRPAPEVERRKTEPQSKLKP